MLFELLLFVWTTLPSQEITCWAAVGSRVAVVRVWGRSTDTLKDLANTCLGLPKLVPISAEVIMCLQMQREVKGSGGKSQIAFTET